MTGPAVRASRAPSGAPRTALFTAPFTAPFTGRARREAVFCALGLPLSFPLPVIGFAVTIRLAYAAGPPWDAGGNPSWLAVLTAVAVAAGVAVPMVATGAARVLAALSRRLAG